MTMGQQDSRVDDCIQPRSQGATERIEGGDPWTTIGPDEVTIRDAGVQPEQPSYAELIRLMTASYRERELS